MVWLGIKRFIEDYKLGDISSLVGVAISVFGFFVTVLNIRKARSAADSAKVAAESTRSAMQFFELIVDFSGAISLIDEIKRCHRRQEWLLVTEHYPALRKNLINLRASKRLLRDDQSLLLQNALTDLYEMESIVEQAQSKGTKPNIARLNGALARNADALIAMLAEFKTVQKDFR